ncbi:topoisomerase II [Marinobacterium aestuariivivens]|uniref:Topoisomerase II n=1 Tax=Marinobacterium aestuariivivens TaxID=1698799 RepID=A0ABW2AA07_9GAMM
MDAVRLSLPIYREEVQLELDLFGSTEPSKPAKVIPFEPRFEWDEKAIFELREGLLWHSLKVLADGRAGEGIKQETMEWLMSDDIHPFSFVVCCSELGYLSSELREQTLAVLHQQERAKVRESRQA